MQVSIVCNVGGGAGGGGASGEHALKERRAANNANAANSANRANRTEPTRTALLGHAHMNEAPGHHGDMMYRSLGKSGLRVSCLGLGTLSPQMSDQEVDQILTLAFESGVNLFDTAEIHAAGRAEVTLGSVLKRKSWRRSSYVVTTKIQWSGQAETERGLSRKHIIEGVRSALCRLQLNYVDIVFVNRSDASTSMEEVVRSMNSLIDLGLTLYWGTSHWIPAHIMEAFSVCRQFNLDAPVCDVSHYDYFHRDKVELHLKNIYLQIGVGVVTLSPVASGFTSRLESRSSVQGDGGHKQQDRMSQLLLVSERLNCSPQQLALAWCLRSGGVSSVLMGVVNTQQLQENLGSLRVLPLLDDSVLSEMDELLGNKPQEKRSDTRN